MTMHGAPLRLSRRAALAAGLATSGALALGRTPHGGVLRVALPWPVGSLDPHAIDDALAALFGAAVADALYAVDATGRPYPALAAALPEPVAGGHRVELRPNLMTARGRALDARDVVHSLKRSATAGGAGLLEAVGKVTHDPKNALAVLITGTDGAAVAETLASPLCAIVPRGYSPQVPDGTGPFVADLSGARATLKRNPHAARGAAFLDRIEIAGASDLSEPLRAFETGETDMSWLGQFLHKPRAGAIAFDAGAFGWVVLFGGRDAGPWAAPGALQPLLDDIRPAQLSHLGLHGLPSGGSGTAAWGGEPAEIIVPEDSPHLVHIAKQLAALLGNPGHELRAAARPRSEIALRRRTSRFALALDFVRSVAPGPRGAMLSLLTALDPRLARRPPAVPPGNARGVGKSSALGVVGELRITGAAMPAFQGLAAWDLGAVWRR